MAEKFNVEQFKELIEIAEKHSCLTDKDNKFVFLDQEASEAREVDRAKYAKEAPAKFKEAINELSDEDFIHMHGVIETVCTMLGIVPSDLRDEEKDKNGRFANSKKAKKAVEERKRYNIDSEGFADRFKATIFEKCNASLERNERYKSIMDSRCRNLQAALLNSDALKNIGSGNEEQREEERVAFAARFAESFSVLAIAHTPEMLVSMLEDGTSATGKKKDNAMDFIRGFLYGGVNRTANDVEGALAELRKNYEGVDFDVKIPFKTENGTEYRTLNEYLHDTIQLISQGALRAHIEEREKSGMHMGNILKPKECEKMNIKVTESVREKEEFHKSISKPPYRAITKVLEMMEQLCATMASSLQKTVLAAPWYKSYVDKAMADFQTKQEEKERARRAEGIRKERDGLDDKQMQELCGSLGVDPDGDPPLDYAVEEEPLKNDFQLQDAQNAVEKINEMINSDPDKVDTEVQRCRARKMFKELTFTQKKYLDKLTKFDTLVDAEHGFYESPIRETVKALEDSMVDMETLEVPLSPDEERLVESDAVENGAKQGEQQRREQGQEGIIQGEPVQDEVFQGEPAKGANKPKSSAQNIVGATNNKGKEADEAQVDFAGVPESEAQIDDEAEAQRVKQWARMTREQRKEVLMDAAYNEWFDKEDPKEMILHMQRAIVMDRIGLIYNDRALALELEKRVSINDPEALQRLAIEEPEYLLRTVDEVYKGSKIAKEVESEAYQKQIPKWIGKVEEMKLLHEVNEFLIDGLINKQLLMRNEAASGTANENTDETENENTDEIANENANENAKTDANSEGAKNNDSNVTRDAKANVKFDRSELIRLERKKELTQARLKTVEELMPRVGNMMADVTDQQIAQIKPDPENPHDDVLKVDPTVYEMRGLEGDINLVATTEEARKRIKIVFQNQMGPGVTPNDDFIERMFGRKVTHEELLNQGMVEALKSDSPDEFVRFVIEMQKKYRPKNMDKQQSGLNHEYNGNDYK